MDKRYLWIVEVKVDGVWEPSIISFRNRKEAREEKKACAKQLKINSGKLRVVKYIPAPEKFVEAAYKYPNGIGD